MVNKRSISTIVLIVLIGCGIMAWVDAVLSPSYAIKSVIKLSLFLVMPFIYSFKNQDISIGSIFVLNKKKIICSLGFGICVYGLIIGAYFLIGPFFDFSNITKTLENNIGINKNNFIFVALYISFINSLLEEIFFRGFAFLTLKKVASKRFAYLFSAAAFSVYHIAIMTNWFTPLLYIILIVCLFVAGLLFNWLNERHNTIYTSWMVHMFANFAINTIGFILFGII